MNFKIGDIFVLVLKLDYDFNDLRMLIYLYY